MPTYDMTGEEQLKVPSDVQAVVATFDDRRKADPAVDALTAAGFGTDQVSFVARGAETVDGKFQPGVLMITVHAEGREAEARSILREHGAKDLSEGVVSASGAVEAIGASEEEEAPA